ncbi:MAG TPA: DUF4386 domain-containing protein [Anaerolineales bacterium]|nr:DUF4386 domain-containing protein [Anaerolineales bacterium]
MTTRAEVNSIQKNAKIAGVLYLLVAGLAGFVHFYVPGKLIVSGDAGITASNILASEGLFRMSIASELVILLSEIVLSILLYVLLKPVNKTLSLVAAVSRLAMTTIHGVNLLNHFFVLLLVGGAGYLTVFQPDQLNALVTLFLNSYNYGYTIGIVFFTLHTFTLAYLIFKSGYFPKVLGVLFMVAAFGYLIDGFSHVLIAGYKTGPAYLALPIAIAEIAFPLWLLIKGVNVDQWEKRALESASFVPLPTQ